MTPTVFLSIVGVYVVRTSSLNDKHSCQLSAKQRQVSMFLILLFKLLTQFPFVSFLSISILSLLPFLILSLLSLHHAFFLFWSILCPPKIKTSIFISYILFTNGTYFCILFHTMTFFFNNAFYKICKNYILMLEFQLVIPWGLEETRRSVEHRTRALMALG